MRIAVGTAVLLASFLTFTPSAFSQDGCRQVQASCSQMKSRCEQNCQSQQNPSRCMGAVCEATMNNCRQTGIWKAVGVGSACWKTNNKS
jgi:hypothetical protein